jgi:hypothetical protein
MNIKDVFAITLVILIGTPLAWVGISLLMRLDLLIGG